MSAASLVDLKFPPQSNSGCLDCIWKDFFFSEEYVLLWITFIRSLAQYANWIVYLNTVYFPTNSAQGN